MKNMLIHQIRVWFKQHDARRTKKEAFHKEVEELKKSLRFNSMDQYLKLKTY